MSVPTLGSLHCVPALDRPDLLATPVAEALRAAGAPEGLFALVSGREVGTALVQAYLASGKAMYLDRARQSAEFIVARLRNPAGGYFDCAGGEVDLRKSPLTDPDQNGAAASFFLSFVRAGGDATCRQAAQ